jgi:hypothetical protein
MMVLRKMLQLASSLWEQAVAWLLIGAIFFAMRSCEYLDTSASEEKRRTKMLRMKNIVFKKDGAILSQSHPCLHQSNLVIITFEFQKNDKRDVSIHMFATNDPILNPVKAWAYTVKRVWSYTGTTVDTQTCVFMSTTGFLQKIKANHARDHLRAIVELIGVEKLGFSKDEI